MKGLTIILSIISFLNTGIKNDLEKFEIRIYNNSNFKIENYEIDINGIITQFSDIEPHSYSQPKKINHFDEFTSFNITVSKERFLIKDFRTSDFKFPIGITCYFNGRRDSFKDGKYVIKLNIKRIKNNCVKVETEYIKE
ncbi:hypothetical protein [uncultured Aquimarina sp.]|uniref:hypothetical protein n=1 Tax=uncultured Aquimarina sp. TaxID=575652 RepID=UPI00261BF70C|nr:hypothetical protein [uncultured Aquimarina sp.]